MKEIYRLDGAELPSIPVPHDCIVREIRLEGQELVFRFEDTVTLHDLIRVYKPNAESLTVTFHLLNDVYDITLLRRKTSALNRAFHRAGVYRETDIYRKISRLTELTSGKLEYLYHYVGYRSILVRLHNGGDILLELSADRVELDWLGV